MKKISLLIAFMVVTFGVSAQHYDVGDINISLGIGAGSSVAGELKLPPTSLSFEYGVAENIGIGVFGGIATAKDDFKLSNGNAYRWDYQHIMFGVRGAYHFYSQDNLNIYAGIHSGLNIASAEFSSDDIAKRFVDDVDVGGFVYSVFAGARYYFNDMIGGYAELGYGVAYLNIGLTAKF
jgi:hypothetical protein